MTGEEPPKPAPRPAAQFRVQENTTPSRTMAGTTPLPPVAATPPPVIPVAPDRSPERAVASSPIVSPSPAAAPSFASPASATMTEPPPVEAPAAPPVVSAPPETFVPPVPAARQEAISAPIVAPPNFSDAAASLLAGEDDVEDQDNLGLDELPSTQYVPPPSLARVEAPEPEIDFGQSEKPQKPAEVKTVKVRSSIDVMAELEALRKRSTSSGSAPAPKPKRDAAVAAALDNLANPPRAKRELHKNIALQLDPALLARARSLRVTVSFDDGDQGVLHSDTQTVELGDTTDVQTLSVSLKVDLA
jgi:hypothetical protein